VITMWWASVSGRDQRRMVVEERRCRWCATTT
jgi:hypothetical protein